MSIKVDKITKIYDEIRGLRATSFEVEVNEIVAIVGHNGAGKSTLLKILANWIIADSGSAQIDHISIGERKKLVHRMGFVPESPNLFDSFSTEYNLCLFARLFHLPASRVDDVCRELNLESFRHQKVQTLSKGQRQRVSLGRTMLADPGILLLDEPTSGLDFEMTRDIHQSLKSLHKSGKTIIFTSHRPEEVKMLAKRVIVLHGGYIAFDGTPEDYFQSEVHQKIFA